MRGIGQMARASGLSVSALRFYDRAGVLVSAVTDPGSGYRRYAPDQVHAARLVAGFGAGSRASASGPRRRWPRPW
ncbi:MerR family DNA-binding transcriptional regulator [Phytoactinopolyspora alkaliphila]|uniref:MerR family DNA-binding transcriptional regulator n=1 Tax=Phytoactinopolyspora alkaliphila TaxID=1783498 RepID=A0A6N9YRR2_9ACTN|nr:MerR family DNA-binding transcriptional regulator [Phytoactinopolyspora alkaliphila]